MKMLSLCFAGLFSLFFPLPGPADAADRPIVIGGTGSGLGIIRLLAEEFMSGRSDLQITVLPSLGSSGGIFGVKEGALDIGLSSRPPQGDEEAYGLTFTPFGKTPFIFVTHRNCGCRDVTPDLIEKIYSGRIRDWPEGGRVRPILRPPKDGDIRELRRISPAIRRAVNQALANDGLITALTDQDAARNIETIPGAFGTSTLVLVRSEKRAVKVLTYQGIPPMTESLADGTYPLSKTLSFVTAPDGHPETGEFINFVFSERGGDILKAHGCLPFPNTSLTTAP